MGYDTDHGKSKLWGLWKTLDSSPCTGWTHLLCIKAVLKSPFLRRNAAFIWFVECLLQVSQRFSSRTRALSLTNDTKTSNAWWHEPRRGEWLRTHDSPSYSNAIPDLACHQCRLHLRLHRNGSLVLATKTSDCRGRYFRSFATFASSTLIYSIMSIT